MAGFSIYDEDFTKKLDSLAAGFDETAKSALEKAAPKLVLSMKSAARSAVQHEGESEMVDSIKPKITKAKNGAWIANVIPTGYSNHTFNRTGKGKKVRKYRVTNAAKMVWLEYGNRGGRQPARPFIAKAVNKAESSVLSIIQEEVNARVEK